MSQRPADLPRWADVGGDIVEPSSGRKDVGWITGLRPAAQFFNWWMNKVFQWIEYTQDINKLNWLPLIGYQQASQNGLNGRCNAVGVADGVGQIVSSDGVTRTDEAVFFYDQSSLVSFTGVGGHYVEVDYNQVAAKDAIYVPSLDRWVVVGDLDRINTRPSLGTVWTARTSAFPGSPDIEGVAVGDVSAVDTLVAVGEDDGGDRPLVQTSINGTGWTLRTAAVVAGGFDAFDVTHDPVLNLFVLVGASADATRPGIQTSPDGINWTEVTSFSSGLGSSTWSLADGILRSVASDGNGTLVAVGDKSGTDDIAQIWHSTNGSDWTRVDTPPAHRHQSGLPDSDIVKVRFVGGRFIAVIGTVAVTGTADAGAGILESVDGSDWTRNGGPSGGFGTEIATGDFIEQPVRGYRAIGGNGDGLMLTANLEDVDYGAAWTSLITG